MDFDLSDDQLALREGADDLLEGLASSTAVRAVVERGGGIDRVLWQAMVDQGWLGVARPEAEGGLGLGWVEVAVLAESVGRFAVPAPFVSQVLAVDALALAPTPDPRAEALLAGETVGCVAWSRAPDAVHATRSGDGWTLAGRADPALYAPSADVVVVAAATDAGPALFAVDVDEDSRPPAESAMDRTRELGRPVFDGTPADWIGGEDRVEALVDRGATATAAEMLGGAVRVLDLAVEYAKDRVQFDKPIGSFQAVKHRCADMLVDVEGMRSSTYWAAWCLAADAADAPIAASTAKIWGSDASRRVMASGLQVHGGIGFTWEHDLHFFLKRAQLDQLTFGDASYHRERLAALLRPRVEAGDSIV
ncbi:MAG TPA: acyl-CoA dehydrogenase family protein [Acidimicrobiia bacterium]|nr:acyl-CoA dehydrogenase family protein [Acidimicrobiia bacterium]